MDFRDTEEGLHASEGPARQQQSLSLVLCAASGDNPLRHLAMATNGSRSEGDANPLGGCVVLREDIDFNRALQRAVGSCRLLHEESERGCALVGGAILEEMLGALLVAFFSRCEASEHLLSQPTAPLGSFAARSRACRALGLLSEDYFRDIERIRQVRNQAAHFERRNERGLDFRFEAPLVADRMRSLVSIPESIRAILPPRILFESFVSMSAAIFREYAFAARLLGDNMTQGAAIHLLLTGMPTIDWQTHFGRLVDRQPSADGKGSKQSDEEHDSLEGK